jgi:hypothetical protein
MFLDDLASERGELGLDRLIFDLAHGSKTRAAEATATT